MKTVLYSLLLTCLLAGVAQAQGGKKMTHKKHKVGHKMHKKEAGKEDAEKKEEGTLKKN